MEKFLKGIGLFVASLVSGLWWTYVKLTMYNWFVLSFLKVPITFWQMYGVVLFWALFNFSTCSDDLLTERTYEEKCKLFGFSLFYPGILLLTGWIVKTYFI